MHSIIKAQRVTGTQSPHLDIVYTLHLTQRAGNIIKDLAHPGHHLFAPLLCGRRIQNNSHMHTNRLRNRFCTLNPQLALSPANRNDKYQYQYRLVDYSVNEVFDPFKLRLAERLCSPKYFLVVYPLYFHKHREINIKNIFFPLI